MEAELKETPFDNKKALILKGHPHEDEVAICKGAQYAELLGKWGLIFESKETGESFFVFDKKQLKWI